MDAKDTEIECDVGLRVESLEPVVDFRHLATKTIESLGFMVESLEFRG